MGDISRGDVGKDSLDVRETSTKRVKLPTTGKMIKAVSEPKPLAESFATAETMQFFERG
jgi:hypothetical protein